VILILDNQHVISKRATEPTFTLGLDIEDYSPFNGFKVKPERGKNHTGMRKASQFLFDTLEKYRIPATWAIVGHLLQDMDEENHLYTHSSYLTKDLLTRIVTSRVGHEIGYHSFSHIDFSRCSREVAELEMKKGMLLADKLGVRFQSFVFPFNKTGHISVLKSYGFEIFRGINLERWSVDQPPYMQRINSIIDLLTPPSTTQLLRIEGMWSVSSSMGLTVNDTISAHFLTFKAKVGVLEAIRKNSIFHVFLHPWNLVQNPSLQRELDKLLFFVSKKRNDGRVTVKTMRALVPTNEI